ncbi:MAG: tetratricopeptide repeat protein [Candidatus Omnitrophica bacterium]|nr:tetratricopeptide repeat protein [Candidatus Omnitrophota bacterium]MDE2221767.1 tetratricopeptide repeat protein [Candidatus Omnitrophota bacterium]
MKKPVLLLIILLALAGCQKPQEQQPSLDQRKDIGHKLIVKSLQDLQNKDLKGSIVDLETSIKVNPSEPEAYLLLGQILLKVQQYDQAAQFLDMTAKAFPDNGTVFYMLSIANKMAGKKLPAVLAARRSVEIFQAQQDRDNMLKSAALLHDLIGMPENPAAAASAKTVPASEKSGTGTKD